MSDEPLKNGAFAKKVIHRLWINLWIKRTKSWTLSNVCTL